MGSILSRNLASKLFFFLVEVVDPTSNLLAIPEVASFVTSLYPDAVVVGSIAACGLGSGRHQFWNLSYLATVQWIRRATLWCDVARGRLRRQLSSRRKPLIWLYNLARMPATTRATDDRYLSANRGRCWLLTYCLRYYRERINYCRCERRGIDLLDSLSSFPCYLLADRKAAESNRTQMPPSQSQEDNVISVETHWPASSAVCSHLSLGHNLSRRNKPGL